MPPRAGKKRRSSSPDPLAAPLEDCIVASPAPEAESGPSSSRRATRGTPRSGPPTPTPRTGTKPSVLATGKRKSTQGSTEDVADSPDPRASLAKKVKTPASTRKEDEMPAPSTTRSSRKGKEKALNQDDSAATPSAPSTRRSQATPGSKSAATPTPVRPSRSTLGSAMKPLPTPSPTLSKARAEATPPMRHFDEAFGDPFGGGEAISTEVFRANESLRKQREARNFRYEGDADAPKLTRSGKIVRRREMEVDTEEGERDGAGAEADAYGAGNGEGEDDDMLGMDGEGRPDIDMDVDIPAPAVGIPSGRLAHDTLDTPAPPDPGAVKPLLPAARQHILRILSTLTGNGIARDPPPFADEDTNEALQGLVNLLKGTVERGEGNSAMLVGPRGTGKTRTIARALQLLPSSSTSAPIIVRLSGHAQTNDRLAIREMGKQIAEAEGEKPGGDEAEDEEAEGEDQEYAPTTLPSHLLALLTVPSPRAIIIVMEEFDLFTEHARQALLYCLLDVVQSVKTGPVESTGRGVAVIGLTSRIDTLLLLEKRVKSRFSHRVWRVSSPLAPGGPGWKVLLKSTLCPSKTHARAPTPAKKNGRIKPVETEEERWFRDWRDLVDIMLEDEDMTRYLDRLTGLTTDVRNLYRPFIIPLVQYAASLNTIGVRTLTASVLSQIELAGWGLAHTKLKGLAQPEQAVLVISKHLAYAGREEFNFAQVEEEYLRFARTRLVGSGKVRWPVGVLRVAFDNLLHLGLLVPTGHSSLSAQFAKVRCTLTPHEIVAWFKGEGANLLSTELANWGRMMGGHA